MADQNKPKPNDDGGEQPPATPGSWGGPTPPRPQRPPRIPPPDPAAAETGKVFAQATDPDVPLTVTISDGQVTKKYAPAELIAKVSHAVNSVVSTMSGTGYDSMFYGAAPGNSMRLFFGDPEVFTAASGQIHLTFVYDESLRVADLIDLDDEDEFFGRAIEIGKPAEKYADLARLVHTEQITMKWQPRGQQPRVLTPGRALRQYTRLSVPGETVAHPLTINGTLYRAITEPSSAGGRGTVGIKLHSWSALPPGVKKGSKLRAITFTSPEVAGSVKNGLLGEDVEAEISIRTSRIGTTIDPNGVALVLESIRRGRPDEAPAHEGQLFDDGPLFDDTE